MFVTGAAVQYLRDSLGIIGTAAETEALALRGTAEQASTWCPRSSVSARRIGTVARGAILGLTRGSGRAEITRATLEAVAYQSRDLLGGNGRRHGGVARSEGARGRRHGRQ